MQGPIGMYDSGVGGLTVWKALKSRYPRESVVYFGDTARVPYGGRPKEEILTFSREILGFLQREGAKAILVACNTSSAWALPQLKEESPVPVFGLIEPGARLALSVTQNGKIGVLATLGTVNSGAYQKAMGDLDPGAQVFSQACPALVPLVEAGKTTGQEALDASRQYLTPLLDAGVDTVIYGCTHYPFLSQVFQEIAGEGVRFVDPAQALVEEACSQLQFMGLLGGTSQSDRFYVSGDPEAFRRLGQGMLGETLPVVVRRSAQAGPMDQSLQTNS